MDMQIGSWRFTQSAARLAAGDVVRVLTPQQMAVLVALVGAANHTLSKDALLTLAWPGKVVSDDAITRVVSDLRKLLDCPTDDLKYIKTLHGFGYQLDVQVSPVAAAGPPLAGRRKAALVATVLALLSACAAFVLLRDSSRTTGEWAVALKTHHLALSPHEQHIAHPVLAQQISLRASDAGTQLILHEGSSPRTIARLPGRISSAASSPDGRTLAFIAEQSGCAIQAISLADPASIRTLASCQSQERHALAWQDNGTLLFASGSRRKGFALITMPLAAAPRVESLAMSCDAITGLAAGPKQDLYLSCETDSGNALVRRRQGQLETLFDYRTVRKFVVDRNSNIYMITEPGWKAGITRYDAEHRTFTFANTGSVAGEQLIIVRDMANPDLLATRLGDLTFENIEAGKTRSAAFAVDPDSASLWQIDDRAGPFAIYRDGQLVKLDRAIDVDLTRIVDMRVDEKRRQLILRSREQDEMEEFTIGLAKSGNGPMPVIRRSTSSLAPLADACEPTEVRTAKGRVRIAGASFEELDASGARLRLWQDKRVSAPCGASQVQYDHALDRLIFLTQPPSYRDISSIELGGSKHAK
ncbi:MAG: winged helix-turn-helix domain-containing protein [Pseudomonadota bacterium]